MKKIWAADTDLGVINYITLTSNAREQMRSFTVNDMKEEHSDQHFRNIDI